MKRVFLCGLLAAAVCWATDANAADITLARFLPSVRWYGANGVTIEGAIVAGDFARFRALVLSEPSVQQVFLASPGGDFFETLRIGRLIRALNLFVTAPFNQKTLVSLTDPKNNTCASACFFLYVAGVQRAGDTVGVHRPFLAKAAYTSMSLEEAARAHGRIEQEVANYLDEMGVPPKYLSMIMETDSGEIAWLASEDIKRDFDGFISQYDEWFKVQCPRQTATDNIENENLVQKYLHDQENEQERALVHKHFAWVDCIQRRLWELQQHTREKLITAPLEHRVTRGETLPSIAKRYGTTVARIKKLSGLQSNVIHVGQRLVIPGLSAPAN